MSAPSYNVRQASLDHLAKALETVPTFIQGTLVSAGDADSPAGSIATSPSRLQGQGSNTALRRAPASRVPQCRCQALEVRYQCRAQMENAGFAGLVGVGRDVSVAELFT